MDFILEMMSLKQENIKALTFFLKYLKNISLIKINLKETHMC